MDSPDVADHVGVIGHRVGKGLSLARGRLFFVGQVFLGGSRVYGREIRVAVHQTLRRLADLT